MLSGERSLTGPIKPQHFSCSSFALSLSLSLSLSLFLSLSLALSLSHSLYLFIHLSLHLSLHHSGVLISCGCPMLHPLPKNSHGFSLTISLTLAVFFSP